MYIVNVPEDECKTSVILRRLPAHERLRRDNVDYTVEEESHGCRELSSGESRCVRSDGRHDGGVVGSVEGDDDA